jgi:hypothetical protein
MRSPLLSLRSKLLISLLFSAASTLALAACGDDETSPTGATGPTGQAGQAGAAGGGGTNANAGASQGGEAGDSAAGNGGEAGDSAAGNGGEAGDSAAGNGGEAGDSAAGEAGAAGEGGAAGEAGAAGEGGAAGEAGAAGEGGAAGDAGAAGEGGAACAYGVDQQFLVRCGTGYRVIPYLTAAPADEACPGYFSLDGMSFPDVAAAAAAADCETTCVWRESTSVLRLYCGKKEEFSSYAADPPDACDDLYAFSDGTFYPSAEEHDAAHPCP